MPGLPEHSDRASHEKRPAADFVDDHDGGNRGDDFDDADDAGCED
jgi:hypothetical protein